MATVAPYNRELPSAAANVAPLTAASAASRVARKLVAPRVTSAPSTTAVCRQAHEQPARVIGARGPVPSGAWAKGGQRPGGPTSPPPSAPRGVRIIWPPGPLRKASGLEQTWAVTDVPHPANSQHSPGVLSCHSPSLTSLRCVLPWIGLLSWCCSVLARCPVRSAIG